MTETTKRHLRLASNLLGIRMWVKLVPFFVLACSNGEAPEEASIPDPIRTEFDRTAPLSADDVSKFLSSIKQLPNKQIPEFTPLNEIPSPKNLAASEHVEQLRKKLDRQLDPRLQSSRWRHDPQLVQSLKQAGYTPEDFADILVRVSCAFSALALNEELNLAEIHTNASEKLKKTIENLDTIASFKSALTREQQQIKANLESQLLQWVGLVHFSELLQTVPQASLQAVAAHRKELKHLLPESPVPDGLKKSKEFFSEIIPTSYEQTK